MQPLNLPPYNISIRKSGNRDQIFDVIRRKFVALTPEEWVRQHFVHFLIEHKGYPMTLLANEVQLHVGDKTVRADSVLYNHFGAPQMIMEYKAPTIALTQKVFDQISVYNLLLHVDYLIVSNGLQTYACKMDYDNQKYLFLTDIPDYQNI